MLSEILRGRQQRPCATLVFDRIATAWGGARQRIRSHDSAEAIHEQLGAGAQQRPARTEIDGKRVAARIARCKPRDERRDVDRPLARHFERARQHDLVELARANAGDRPRDRVRIDIRRRQLARRVARADRLRHLWRIERSGTQQRARDPQRGRRVDVERHGADDRRAGLTLRSSASQRVVHARRERRIRVPNRIRDVDSQQRMRRRRKKQRCVGSIELPYVMGC